MNETFTSKIDVNSQIIGKVLVCTLHSILSGSLDEPTPNVAFTVFFLQYSHAMKM
jgi:hypothetical protein